MLCRHFRVSDLPAFFRIYQSLPALPSCHRKYRHLTFPSTYPVQDRWSEGQGWLFLCRLQHSAGETAELSFPSLRDFVFLEATSVIMFVSHKVDTEEGFESMSFAVTAELIGAARKKYASCHKYSTNCGFIPILKKEKSLEALNFQGILVAEEGFEPTTFGL